MDMLFQDLKQALRALRKSPGFTALAVLTLAVGIGANATLFTWINAVLFSPLPGTETPQRLVEIHGTSKSQGVISVSYPDYRDLRDGARSLAGLIATDERPMSLRVGSQSERVWAQLVSGNYFDVLGVPAFLGRGFRPEEDRVPGRDAVVVLGHGLFVRRFGGDPRLLGTTVSLNGHAYTVVGVAPPAFLGSIIGLSFDAWVPMAMQQRVVPGGDRLEDRDRRWLDVMGRLAPGVGKKQAQAEIDAVTARLAKEYPATNEGLGLAAYHLDESPRGVVPMLSPVFRLLAVAVGLVLLIACANVANLLLARAAGRRREIALRLSLGATRGRLVRQLLTESLLLAVLSGGAGVLLAYWSVGLLSAFAPPSDLPVGLVLAVDGEALAFALVVSVLTGLLFGLVPALRCSRPDLIAAIKDEAGAAGGRGPTRIRSSLVVAQVALSLVLLVSAGLLLKSLRAAQSFDLGFDTRRVLLAALDLFPTGYDRERGRAFYRELLARTRTLPGVESATLARRVPLSMGGTSSSAIEVEGYTPPPKEDVWAYYNQVGPDYFTTLRVAVVAGRDISASDDAGTPPVAVVSETMARRYWGGREAVGGRLRLDGNWFTVVGVVRDIRYRRLDEPPSPVLYMPLLQAWSDAATLHVRSAQEPSALASTLRAEAARLDPAVPLFAVRRMDEHVKAGTIVQRLAGSLLSIFGLTALLLAAVGIYGMLQNAVTERTREIGIRMALGGDRRDVLRLVFGPMLRLSVVGVGLGLLGAAGLGRLLARVLFGVRPADPVTFLAVAALMLATAFVATLVPALRATRVDPVTALRRD